jgi:hypothetical protein
VPRFGWLGLRACRLRAAELPPLLQKLRDAALRTVSEGDTRAEVDE